MTLIKGMTKEIAGNINREICHLRVKPLCSIAFLTYRCTNRCKTCNIWQMGTDSSNELDCDGWLKIVSGLNRLGVRSLEIFGGDALLRKEVIFDLISSCREHKIATFFPTNANLCDTQTITSLIESGLHMLYISIDDIEDAHDQVRGVSGNFAKIREAMENLLSLRGNRTTPELGIICTLSSLNFRNFPRLVEFLEQYPVSVIYPRPLAEFSARNIADSCLDGLHPEPFFIPTDGESHLIKPTELSEFKEMIWKMKKRYNKVYVCWTTYYSTTDATHLKGEYPHQNCRMATTVMIISPNGDVSPCPFYRKYVLGNLMRDKPDDIWGNAKHRRFIRAQQADELPVCLNCNIRPYYNSSIIDMFKFYSTRMAEKSGLCRDSIFK